MFLIYDSIAYGSQESAETSQSNSNNGIKTILCFSATSTKIDDEIEKRNLPGIQVMRGEWWTNKSHTDLPATMQLLSWAYTENPEDEVLGNYKQICEYPLDENKVN